VRPPSTKRVHTPYTLEDLAEHIARIKDIPPAHR
jgi:hypothetical protein